MATPSDAPAVKPAASAKKEKVGTEVTYVPQAGDLSITTWNKHTFHANKATLVTDAAMVEQAKSNPWFNVAGHDPTAVPVDDDLVVPKDSEGYRRYAVAWFKKATRSNDLRNKAEREAKMQDPAKPALAPGRWESEEALRVACGVGTDDYQYLDKLRIPRLGELEKAES